MWIKPFNVHLFGFHSPKSKSQQAKRTIRINIPKFYKFSKDVCKWTPRTNAPIISLPSTITIILQIFSTPWHHRSLNNSTLNLRHRHATKIFLRLSSYPHYFLNLYYACVTTNKETFAEWKSSLNSLLLTLVHLFTTSTKIKWRSLECL